MLIHSLLMEEDQELSKHMCKFCSKSFPCGRSLGGHMRSHLLTIPSSDHSKSKQKPHNERLPPLVKGGRADFSVGTNRALKSGEEDTLLEDKHCRKCGKRFHSWKALFGHMKCHSVNGRTASSVVEDSWDSSKQIEDNLSDNETIISLHRRKRSYRIKRYTADMTSSSLTVANFLPSEVDQMEQEEVALSLIILSGDKGDWSSLNSIIESSDNNSVLSQHKKLVKALGKNFKNSDRNCSKFKKLRNGKLEPTVVESEVKQTLGIDSKSEKTSNSHDVGCSISEVNSPRNLTKEGGLNKSRKRKCIDAAYGAGSSSLVDYQNSSAHSPSDSKLNQDFEQKKKFRCSVCKKGFLSYQALGGHRASNKKFKGSCAPRSENSPESEIPPNKSDKNMNDSAPKEHECPICFKVSSSGQALGGHKKSHLTNDQIKSNPSIQTKKPTPSDIRSFLDLNLPAPNEEECSDYKPCWVATGHENKLLLAGLLSS